MKFSKAQLLQFGADEGAWSVVTENERDKSQITIADSDGEAEVAIRAIGESRIPRSGGSNKIKATLRRRDGTWTTDSLTINFPKKVGNELRVYRNVRAGFDYEAGDVWFLFRKGKELTIGSIAHSEWKRMTREDSEDDEYQRAIVDNSPETDPEDFYYETTVGIRFKRNPKLAAEALSRAKYRCEFDSSANLFTSRSTGKSYVEAHHLVPLAAQGDFKISLDVVDNIVSLSPHWHRAVHLATDGVAREILQKLARKSRRKAFLKKLGISADQLFELYDL